MYLTRIDLKMDNRAIQNALGDCQKLHRLLMGLFCTSRREVDLLYRLKYGRECSVYMYSSQTIDSERLFPGMTLVGQRDIDPWLDNMSDGQRWSFDLLACPSKKVQIPGLKNSLRRVFQTQQERLAWISRKANQYGFELISVKELESSQLLGRHSSDRGGPIYFGAFHYQGSIHITDARLFQKAVSTGIGPGKAYGLGMMILSQ